MNQYKQIDPSKRHLVLSNEAHKVAEETYTRQLTDEEVTQAKDEFARLSMQKSNLEEQKKEEVRAMNDNIKAVASQAKHQLRRAIERRETITGKVFYIPNFEDGMMEMYDAEGEMIHSRKLYPEERQMAMPLKAVN